MKFSQLTLIFSVSITIAFFGTVNPSLRAGAFVLFLFALFLLTCDGFGDYSKAIASGAYGREVLSSLSPSIIIGAIVLVSGLLGIFVGVL